MKSAYIVKMDLKSDSDSIRKKIIEIGNKYLMDLKKHRPWAGFRINQLLYENTGKVELHYGYDKEDNTLNSSYGFEEQLSFDNFAGKLEYYYKRHDVDVWFDFQSKIIILFTSSKGAAFRVLNILIKEIGE